MIKKIKIKIYIILVLLFWGEKATSILNNFFPLRDKEVRKEGKVYGRTVFTFFVNFNSESALCAFLSLIINSYIVSQLKHFLAE